MRRRHVSVSRNRGIFTRGFAAALACATLFLVSCTSETEPEDTAGPVLTLLTPAADTTVSDMTVTISLIAADPGGIASVTIGGQPVTGAENVYTAELPLLPGPNIVAVAATDASPNANQTFDTLIITCIDTKGPVVTILPAADTIVTYDSVAVVVISAVDESGIAWLAVDGDTLRGAENPCTAAVSVRPGMNTVEILAADSSVNQNLTSLTLFILYGDSIPPVIELTSPQDSSTVHNASVSFSLTVTDIGGVDLVTLDGDTLDGFGTFYFGAASLNPGENTMTVTARDSSGNESVVNVTVTYVDTTGPSITVLSPTDRQAFFTDSATVSFSVSDENGVALAAVNEATVTADDSIYTVSIALEEGENTITIMAQDASPGGNRTTVTVRVAFVAGLVPVMEIRGDTSWSGQVNITGPVSVIDAVLTIDAGTIVSFDTAPFLVLDTAIDGGIRYRTAKAGIAVTGSAALVATGTAAAPVRFTSAAASPAAGDWAGIWLHRLTGETPAYLGYCIIEYANTGVGVGSIGDSMGWVEPTDATLDNCLIRHMAGDGIYATNGGVLRVSNTTIDDCDRGMFINCLDSLIVTFCIVHDAGAGIVLPGHPESDNTAIIDHLTVAAIDNTKLKSLTDRWWAGFGLFLANDPGALTFNNSIVTGCTKGGLSPDRWAVEQDYNCYFNNAGSLGTPGPNSIAADPQFEGPGAADLRPADGSPCIDAADDGSTMGASQGGAFWWAGM